MPRCDRCKHAADHHIGTRGEHGTGPERFPCYVKGCDCRAYEPELVS